MNDVMNYHLKGRRHVGLPPITKKSENGKF